MTIPNHIVQARSEARLAAARIVFHPSHLLDQREGGCSACEAQGSALARPCVAEHDDGTFWTVELNEDIDDTFCPTCGMNVEGDHNGAQCKTNFDAINNFVQVVRTDWTPEEVRSGKAHHEYRKAERKICGLGTREVRTRILEAKERA